MNAYESGHLGMANGSVRKYRWVHANRLEGVEMSFWMDLEWGSVESRYGLPDRLLVDALPPEGLVIALTHDEDNGVSIQFEVEVEEVFLDAADLNRVRYKAFVILA